MWGLGVVQHIVPPRWRCSSPTAGTAQLTDDAGGLHTHQFNDFDVVMGGARIKF